MDWGTLVAGYAAGVSTLVAVNEILNEGPRVRVRFQKGMKIWSGERLSEDVGVMTVTNAGRRPVRIINAAFSPTSKGHIGLPSDWIDAMPFTLAEAEYRTLVLHPSFFDNNDVPANADWYVSDSVGRTWPRRVAWKQRIRRRWRRLTFRAPRHTKE